MPGGLVTKSIVMEQICKQGLVLAVLVGLLALSGMAEARRGKKNCGLKCFRYVTAVRLCLPAWCIVYPRRKQANERLLLFEDCTIKTVRSVSTIEISDAFLMRLIEDPGLHLVTSQAMVIRADDINTGL